MRANTGGGPFGYHPSYRKEEPEMTIPHHRPPERPATAGESGFPGATSHPASEKSIA
jgi:hypothetical protein